ncbi:MAG: hypothetical protein SPI14_05030 [Arcanobacterium sp.]|nr:hypothetical protein [Arcanobacterium sp.]
MDIKYWFNTSTNEVGEGSISPWPAHLTMGPYDTRELAEQAYALAAARTAEQDAHDDAWDSWGEDN